MKKEALVLVNVGTPASPAVKDVRRYLHDFLNDPLVIDLPDPFRWLLVNGIIIPFRSPRSAKKYASIWNEAGSPLLIHQLNLEKRLNEIGSDKFDVYTAMRYGEPSLKKIIQKLASSEYHTVTFLPLFPQYAISSTGTILKVITDLAQQSIFKPALKIVDSFYDFSAYLEVFSKHIHNYQPSAYDHVLLSYHGLPDRQDQKHHEAGRSLHPGYKESCILTSELLAGKLGLQKDKYSTSFQSRLSKGWLKPFTDQRLRELAEKGCNNVLVVPASFVADCLETIHEIGKEYRELYISKGGKDYTMTEALNASPDWAAVLLEIASEKARLVF